jgi:hypothetical protein
LANTKKKEEENRPIPVLLPTYDEYESPRKIVKHRHGHSGGGLGSCSSAGEGGGLVVSNSSINAPFLASPMQDARALPFGSSSPSIPNQTKIPEAKPLQSPDLSQPALTVCLPQISSLFLYSLK